MTRPLLLAVVILAFAQGLWNRGHAQDAVSDRIVGLERTALDRWGNGDPGGYLERYAEEVTYFDPSLDSRVDGLPRMTEMLTPLKGKIKIDRYEMIRPKVQRHGDVAVLSYNLVNYRKLPDGTERATTRWNNTEVYRLSGGEWKIIHSHWAYTKPELKPIAPAGN